MSDPDANGLPAYQLRRATVDDLPELKALWTAERLPASELDKRFTEFQIAVDPEGRIAGALGLQIHKTQGLIHSECFLEIDRTVELRPLLWDRVLTVAKNHGLARLWMMPTAHFYREQGMEDASDALRAKLPESFGHPKVDWITLSLRDESQMAISVEKEFEIFAQAQKDETEQMMRRAKMFRALAYGLLVLAIGALAALLFVAKRTRKR